ncbi:MAG: UDP-2,3-diacylglucosamine diphosphatase LpxI [Thermodesulfovibrionales bacterium]
MKKIGIIAGSGALPIQIAKDANCKGYEVFVLALENLADTSIQDNAHKTFWVNIGRLGKLIGILKDNGIKEVVIAGKVPKTLLYKSKITPDLRAIKLLFSIKDRTDDAILNAFANELKGEGIEIIDTTTFSPNIVTPEGLLTTNPPNAAELKDIEFGWKIAKEIGRLDIGQTVVVKGLAVMAVEAIEGTDEAIIRGGNLGGEGTVVVKVSKPQQDMRLDVPTVGMTTLESMIKVKARVLAVEAEKTIIVDRSNFLDKADTVGISVVGYKGR